MMHEAAWRGNRRPSADRQKLEKKVGTSQTDLVPIDQFSRQGQCAPEGFVRPLGEGLISLIDFLLIRTFFLLDPLHDLLHLRHLECCFMAGMQLYIPVPVSSQTFDWEYQMKRTNSK